MTIFLSRKTKWLLMCLVSLAVVAGIGYMGWHILKHGGDASRIGPCKGDLMCLGSSYLMYKDKYGGTLFDSVTDARESFLKLEQAQLLWERGKYCAGEPPYEYVLVTPAESDLMSFFCERSGFENVPMKLAQVPPQTERPILRCPDKNAHPSTGYVNVLFENGFTARYSQEVFHPPPIPKDAPPFGARKIVINYTGLVPSPGQTTHYQLRWYSPPSPRMVVPILSITSDSPGIDDSLMKESKRHDYDVTVICSWYPGYNGLFLFDRQRALYGVEAEPVVDTQSWHQFPVSPGFLDCDRSDKKIEPPFVGITINYAGFVPRGRAGRYQLQWTSTNPPSKTTTAPLLSFTSDTPVAGASASDAPPPCDIEITHAGQRWQEWRGLAIDSPSAAP